MDGRELKAKIILAGKTIREISIATGIRYNRLSEAICNYRELTPNEIARINSVLIRAKNENEKNTIRHSALKKHERIRL